MKYLVQIYILTYNRPEFVEQAVESALNQDFNSFEVVVSDNSTNDETEEVLLRKFSKNAKFKYIKRSPSVPAIHHFNTILGEVTSKYFMMFHDDDVMFPNMLSSLVSEIVKDNTISAVGVNGVVIKHGKKNGTMHTNTNGISTFKNSSEFVTPYLNDTGCVPFPGYLYRTTLVSDSKLELEKGGKYCDVSFLMSVSNRGDIVWVNKPLMNSYLHEGQDSINDAFGDRMKLIKHIVKTTSYKLSDPQMRAFRLGNIYGEIKTRMFKENREVKIKMYLKIVVIAFKHSPKKVFPRLIYFLPQLVFKKH